MCLGSKHHLRVSLVSADGLAAVEVVVDTGIHFVEHVTVVGSSSVGSVARTSSGSRARILTCAGRMVTSASRAVVAGTSRAVVTGTRRAVLTGTRRAVVASIVRAGTDVYWVVASHVGRSSVARAAAESVVAGASGVARADTGAGVVMASAMSTATIFC